MTERLAYRISEVCAMLGIHRATLYRRAKAGDIRIHKFGNVSIVRRDELDRLLPTSLSTPATAPQSDDELRDETAKSHKSNNRRNKRDAVRRHET